ncbi:hypothetical protein ACFVVU_23725 [Kitasatospora sp. NPDC057965]|uniref:hypothetical protein n=1 Tax=Kitasatospora sp. NPDC057965 TaxID=3346291 RepID=UPI0036DD7BFF
MAPVELTWLACDLRTGMVIEELRSLRMGALSRRIGAHTQASGELTLAGAPADWEAATDPGRTLLVAVDPAAPQPLWSGMPLPREGGSANTETISAATPEAYLDHRYPGDYAATGADLTTIMAGLAAPALSDGPPLLLDTVLSGVTADYAVADDEDKSIAVCWQEISEMQGAPEWTVDTVWADAAQTRVQLIARIRPAIGVQLASPEAVFDMPGCVATYKLAEAYGKGLGATRVIARGDRTAGTRATSTAHTATDLLAAGWPLWEHRYTPAQGITSVAQLERHAAEALTLMRTGAKAWTIDAVASTSPRLGVAWGLGDTVRLAVETSPRHPAGVDLVGRAYGWSLDAAADRVSPILLEDS